MEMGEMGDPDLFMACRSCLLLSNNTFPILQTVLQDDEKVLTMLNYFSIEVKEDDDLPKTICHSCILSLQAAYTFVKTLKKSQDILQGYDNCENNIEEDQAATLSEDCALNTEESIIIHCKESDSDSDEEYLIRKSIQLTEQVEQNKHQVYGEYTDTDSDGNFRKVDVKPTTDLQTKYDLFQCPVCLKFFRRNQTFKNHVMGHKGMMKCKICSQFCPSADSYLRHYQCKHMHNCTHCKRSFLNEKIYYRHLQRHENRSPKFSCPAENCTKTFYAKQSLRSHYSTIHSNRRNFLCSLCGIAFKNADNLRYHVKKHSGPTHLCNYCGRGFLQATHLKDHVWRHLGVKPFKCTKCEKSFLTRRILRKHVERNCGKKAQRQVNM